MDRVNCQASDIAKLALNCVILSLTTTSSTQSGRFIMAIPSALNEKNTTAYKNRSRVMLGQLQFFTYLQFR